MLTFGQTFMRIYDRKIQSGEITFSRSGIDKNDFTHLCIDGNYVIPKDRLEIIFEKMNLNEEESETLLAFLDEE